MTDWITQRAREAAHTYAFCAENELVQAFATLLTEAYARGCADQHERTKAEAVKVATDSAGGARYLKIAARNEGDAVGALIRGAEEMEATVIAAAINKMERPV